MDEVGERTRGKGVILRLRRGRRVYEVGVTEVGGRPRVSIDGEPFEADIVRLADGVYSLITEGRSIEVAVNRRADVWEASTGGRKYRLRPDDAVSEAGDAAAEAGGPYELRATLPGRILEVRVAPGRQVQEGDGLVVVEAMKMENELRAPFDAHVDRVEVEKGQTVETGVILCVLSPRGAQEP
jgi:biotin carboxyl carrier protein